MRYRLLGRTGLFVSELSLGVMGFGATGWWGEVGAQSLEEANTFVARALELGVNLFDTAEAYSDGESERMLGRALGSGRKDVLIATKASGRGETQSNNFGLSRLRIMRAVEESILRLNTDYIDLYQIHVPDPLTPIDETLRALEDLVRAGKVRYVGCSNQFAWQVMQALGIAAARNYSRFESVQAYYSVAGRDIERELVPLLVDQKIGLLVWSPLAGGFLTDKFATGEGPPGARRTRFDFPPLDKDRALRCISVMHDIAVAHECTVARIALAWLLHQEVVTSVIVGARTIDHLEDNLQAGNVSLVPDELARIDAASSLSQEYPGWLMQHISERGRKLTNTKPVAEAAGHIEAAPGGR